MDIVQLAQDALTVIQQAEPGLTAAVKAGTALGTMGTAAVKVLQKGKQLVTYLISRAKQKPASEEPQPRFEKRDVALLIDINRRMLQDVARYLDEKGIDADLIVVTNDQAYSDRIQFLNPESTDEWIELTREFSSAMNTVKHAVGGARIHVFLSTPLPLAFGLGSVWGTVDQATLYHWERQTYHPVLEISRDLRQ